MVIVNRISRFRSPISHALNQVLKIVLRKSYLVDRTS